jgi:tetratricopeptide (TPR) repeat protein
MYKYKRYLFFLFYAFLPLLLLGQAPRWLSSEGRQRAFPEDIYVTGFAVGDVRSDETALAAMERLKKEAQGLLSDGIRVKVESERKSYSKSESVNSSETLSALFESAVKTSSAAEIVGVKADAYLNESENMVYAFAYAKRQELIDFYQADIALDAQRVEGFFGVALQLEKQGDKAKARKQYEEAIPLLAKVSHTQGMLVALSKGAAAAESLQQGRVESLFKELQLALARLEQNVSIFVESSEDIFGSKSTSIVANKLKAALAKSSRCTFTDDASQSDYKLSVHATTRESGTPVGSLTFCYADVTVELMNRYTGKVVYQDEISQKGGSVTLQRAGRQACEDVALKIAEKIKPWLGDEQK